MPMGFSAPSLNKVPDMSKDVLIGIDGGGSKTLVLLADSAGNILGKGESGPSNYQAVGQVKARQAILAAVAAAFQDANRSIQPPAVLCAGLAGVDRQSDQEWVLSWLGKETQARQIILVNDAILLLWAGTPSGWGIGLVSGTGSMCIGRSPDGIMARAGGWGYLLGDEGSGYAIGLAALHAVTQSADGRAPETILLERILQKWGGDTPQNLVPMVYNQPITRQDIAGLAPLVIKAATDGDQVSKAILDQAVQDLALAVLAVTQKLNLKETVPWAVGGGLLIHCDLLVEGIISATQKSGITLNPVTKVDQPVLGAVQLALHKLHSGE